jgi:thiamine biosynthesis lipoprotein
MPKRTEIIMGMPITVETVDEASEALFDKVFAYFDHVDKVFSPYKKDSFVSKINRGLPKATWPKEVKQVLELCEQTKQDTKGYFDINFNGRVDPSGLVKGWSIHEPCKIIRKAGVSNFYIEAGGDIEAYGAPKGQAYWSTGIRSPFNTNEIIKVIKLTGGKGLATSGTYIRGQHIYDPIKQVDHITKLKSLSVVGPNIYEADRYATAAYAMGIEGIAFIESTIGLEGYMVTDDHKATYTSGFKEYIA